MQPDLKKATLSEIASIIRLDWANVNFAAAPYLDSMSRINTVQDAGYGYDMPNEQVLYFLSNATGWRGETARTIKAELKRRIK